MTPNRRKLCHTTAGVDIARRFAATDGGVVEQFNEGDAFGQLLGAAGRVAEQHAEMPGADVAAMYIAAADFVGAVYPDRLDYIDRVLASCHEARARLRRAVLSLLFASLAPTSSTRAHSRSA